MNSGLGQTIGGRYRIITQLGQGGFGTTFLAEDKHLPGNHRCVVKQLKPQATDPVSLQTARRLFDTEAKVLHQLGTYDQIPQLFAYFEENQEFYLVQELIEGDDLSKEILPGQKLTENQVISLLRDILKILEFVHQHNVIHRDVNPRNLIRRKLDGKLVLIDFGAVKQVSTQVLNGKQTSFTIAIGTPGYRPSEQANGNPKLSSDIYAVGMIGIQALTGIVPEQLPSEQDTGEISWQEHTSVRPEVAKILNQMIRYDFRERYQSATSALQALNDLNSHPITTVALPALAPPQRFRPQFKFPKLTLSQILISTGVLGLGITATISLVNLLHSANATQLYHRGETLLELKRYEEALAVYQRAVEIRPEYAQAWQGKGDAFLELKQYDEALDAYDKAIQIQPNYLEAWIGRGKTLDNLQRYEEAINAFDAALKIYPSDLGAWQNKGNIQLKIKQYSEALTSFDKAIELNSENSESWYNRGLTLHNLRQYQKAVESFDKAVKSKPDSAQFWYSRGNSLMVLERYPEAVESYDKAVQFQPNLFKAWYSRGSALMNLQLYEQAANSFDKAVKLNPDDYDAWYNRGWALHQTNRYEEAVTSYNKAIQLRRNAHQAWYNLGNAYYNLKRYPDAIASYNRAIDIKSDYAQAWYSRGNALVRVERYPDAIKSYDKALQYDPDYRQATDARNQAQNQLESTQKQKDFTEDEDDSQPED